MNIGNETTSPNEVCCMHIELIPKHNNRFRWDIAALLFVMFLGTYAYFWQFRSWNGGVRLMLTYALSDRGTITIDGLEEQSGDRSFRNGHYYCDKPPGQSLLGIPLYVILKLTGVSHPLNTPAIRFWWPDYVLTVATNGILTAVLGVLIYNLSLQTGCRQWSAVMVALTYALGTPAFTYATLFFGHQTAAFLGLAPLALLINCEQRKQWSYCRMSTVGFLAGYAVITEYLMVFTSVGLLVYAVWSGCPLRRLLPFVFAAGICAVGLGWYHTMAFGGPFKTGYIYKTEPEFQEIYTDENPTGLTCPNFERAGKILFSAHGLVWYAPVVLLAPLGLWILSVKKQWKLVFMIVLAFGSFFLVNASHPTWTGGWSTGPRYLIPAMPFVMLTVAAAVAGEGRVPKYILGVLGLIGFLVCVSCTLCPHGGRLPDYGITGGDNPLLEVVFPAIWEGRFGRNFGNVLLYGSWEYPSPGNWWALIPLLEFLGIMLFLLTWRCGRAHKSITAG